MRVSFIDAKRVVFSIECRCAVLEVSKTGYLNWRIRPASERQRKDMVFLAHIRARFRLSWETNGSPRMHTDLMEDDIIAGAIQSLG
jgi:putative transposase